MFGRNKKPSKPTNKRGELVDQLNDLIEKYERERDVGRHFVADVLERAAQRVRMDIALRTPIGTSIF